VSEPEINASPAASEEVTPESPAPTAAPTTAEPTAAELEEAKRYSQVTLGCTLADMALDLVVLASMAVVVGPWIDQWLAQTSALAGERSLLRLAVLGAAITGLHSLVSLPLSYYAGFTVEHRFGLSKQSRGGWFKTWLKKSALTLALLAVMYTGLFAIIWAAGQWWWLVAAVVFFVFSAVLGQLMPVLILPLFYKVDRIQDESSAERMQAMASGVGLSIEGVYRLGLSAETSKANAMLAGIGSTRRVLMGDTLLDEFSPDEVDIVFAHELGHHVHHHLPKLLVMAGAISVAGFYLCHLVLGAWTGAEAALWPTAALPKVVLALTVFSLLVGPLQNFVSRHFERQADRYAIDTTKNKSAFRSAFLKLARLNKAEIESNPIEVMLLHSHPPIGERLRLVGAE